eukprot:6306041-Alexandrium_andersonii.AAC.1
MPSSINPPHCFPKLSTQPPATPSLGGSPADKENTLGITCTASPPLPPRPSPQRSRRQKSLRNARSPKLVEALDTTTR